MRKGATILFLVVLCLSLLVGCSGKTEAPVMSKSYEPEELIVLFRPSQNAETMEAKAKPLENLLSQHLQIPVKVKISTDFNTMIEALAARQVDVGYLAPSAYVLAKEKGAVDVILQSQRYDILTPTGQQSNQLVDYYRAIILVKADSGIASLQDLKEKKIGWQNVSSSAGYVWPAVELMDAGLDPEKDVQGVTLIGFDQGVLAVLNGDVDAACVYEDARNLVKKDFPDVFDQTRILYVTQPIPSDTIAVRSDMSEEWKGKLQNAFIEMAREPEGYQIINELYIHEGYSVSDDSHFDLVREYNQKLGQ